jgi:hypothetical protein
VGAKGKKQHIEREAKKKKKLETKQQEKEPLA